MCSHKYRHTGPTKPGPVFFSLLYKRQNSLNKGKQITPQVGMFITQVTWGYRQPESNIYIHVSTQETVSHNSTLIKNLKKKQIPAYFCSYSGIPMGFDKVFFGSSPDLKKGELPGASGTNSESNDLTWQLRMKQTGWCVCWLWLGVEWTLAGCTLYLFIAK